MPSWVFFVLAAVVIAGYLYWFVDRDKPVTFYRTGRHASQYHTLPPDFEAAWAWVEENLAKATAMGRDARCYLPCEFHQGKATGYRTRYSYNGWSWTGLERQHMMYGHVKHSGALLPDYYLPDKAFVKMVMKAYAERPQQATQPATC